MLGKSVGLLMLLIFTSFNYSFAQVWIPKSTGGFGNSGLRSARSMAVHNNRLYVGTETEAQGQLGEIWEYNGAAWQQVNSEGFDDPNNIAILSLSVYEDSLYAGTENAVTGGQIWKYSGDGVDWQPVNIGGFGDVNNTEANSMAVYSGCLYVGTSNEASGAEVWALCGPYFLRADANTDGNVNLPDAQFTLNWLFLGGPDPGCMASADANADGQVNLPDAQYTLNFLFLGGPQPKAPFPECDVSTRNSDTELGCERSSTEGACVPPPPPSFEGFTFTEINPQGLPEYTHDQTGIVFVSLPGGTFNMGSPDTEPNRNDDEGPIHTVTLDPFLIGKTEVTQAQYEAVMGSNPSFFTGDDLPVEQVSWDDLHAPDGFLERTGLGLPSEAQWEYACRGGTTTAFSFGDECNARNCNPCATADAFMWWCANSGNTTQPVGVKQPNPFGLFDMHGNVWEWCEDNYDSEFYGKPEAAGPNPVATSRSGNRVIRGGSWNAPAANCRSGPRGGIFPDDRSSVLGFRPGFGPLP